MNHTKNNWFNWYYDTDGKFCTNYRNTGVRVMSFRDSLIYNALETMKEYPNETFEIMFSGGIDSELILRIYLELGQKLNVNIFKYENNYNEYDVTFAMTVCRALGVKYRIIDFNLENFYRNDAMSVYQGAMCSHARALPQLQFMNYVDGLPVYASSDMRWFRPNNDYTIKTEWMMQDFEYEIAWDRYVAFQKRNAIMQWFKFTPEIVAGWMQMNWFKLLVNDEYMGKMGVNSTKYIGYREVYPDLMERVKKTGFETADHIVMPFQCLLKDEFSNMEHAQFTIRTFKDFQIELFGS